MSAATAHYATAATRELATAAQRAFADAEPLEVLAWAARTFGSRLAVTSSMADEVVAHLTSTVAPGVDVLFVDTGYHFAETLAFRREVALRMDVTVVDVTPEQTVAEQDALYGAALYGRDPDACCTVRKVFPLNAALEPYDAWVSGVRRAESASRADTPVVGWDGARGMIKINPIAGWSQRQLDGYVAQNGLRANPLRQLGFASIGCAPCTRPVAPGEDPRAGRWAGFDKTECGLHR
jgi:phosphoadenosine phosphosulfate reductase